MDTSHYYTDPKTGTTYTSPEVAKQYGVVVPTTVAPSGTTIQQQTAAADKVQHDFTFGITAPASSVAPPPNPNPIPTPQVTGDASSSLAAAQSSYLSTLQGAPSSYDLYQQELKSRGIDTLIGQEADFAKQAQAQEAALKPLLPENVAINFPKSLQQLQDVGVTQDQLNLLAAKERTPIAAGLADLLKSQSIIAQQIDRQTQLSQYAVQLKQTDYQNKVAVAQLQYSMAKDTADQAFATQKEAKTFAIENGVTTPFYLLNGTVVRTSDGKQYSSPEQFYQDAGVTSFEQAASSGILSIISGQAQVDAKYVSDLRTKYPDAGILASDSATTAAAKLQKSRIYQDQVRGPVGSSGPTDEEKQITAFQNDAGDFIVQMQQGKLNWAGAWGALHAKYPQASTQLIDTTLGLQNRTLFDKPLPQ